NRNVNVTKIEQTEAGCYFGSQAVPLLADEVGTLDDAIAYITNSTGATASTSFTKGTKSEMKTITHAAVTAKSKAGYDDTEMMDEEKCKAEDPADEDEKKDEDEASKDLDEEIDEELDEELG